MLFLISIWLILAQWWRPRGLVHFQPWCTFPTYNNSDIRNIFTPNARACPWVSEDGAQMALHVFFPHLPEKELLFDKQALGRRLTHWRLQRCLDSYRQRQFSQLDCGICSNSGKCAWLDVQRAYTPPLPPPTPAPPPLPCPFCIMITTERLGSIVISSLVPRVFSSTIFKMAIVISALLWRLPYDLYCCWSIKVRESIRMLFLYQANLHDAESALLSHGMRRKCLCFSDLPTPGKGKSGDPWKKIWRFYKK